MNRSSNMYYDRESSDYESEDEKSWISRLCHKYENKYLCEVEESFITDAFNLYGINSEFHLYKQALNVILGEYNPNINNDEIDIDELENNAYYVYGMIHARYIVTAAGLDAMLQKYKNCVFGTCPRVLCNNQSLLPIGESDLPNVSSVRLYCPCCKEIYYPPSEFKDLDGAFFGTTFPHVFLLNYPEYIVKSEKTFEPKIYGYKIHKSSPYYKEQNSAK